MLEAKCQEQPSRITGLDDAFKAAHKQGEVANAKFILNDIIRLAKEFENVEAVDG